MKQLLTTTLIFILVIAAGRTQAQVTSTNNAGTLSVKGAYLMTRQVANDGAKDGVMNNQQLKIYTDHHLIFVHPIEGDSLANYGIGTYSIQDGKVIENIFYTASSGEVKNSYELTINKSGNNFSLAVVIPQSGGRRWNLVEDYNNVSRNVTTPLDGAWKQTKVTHISADGTTHTNTNPTQFKVYESGYFIWVNTARDSATQKPVSQYGYGTFDMQGSNKAVEVNNSSTFKTSLTGKPITLQLEFMGKDAFRQTIVFESGVKMTEEYQRMQ